MPQTVLITGASSGIGKALAMHFARAGNSLGLLGRNQKRLDAVAAACRARGASVRTARIDTRSRGEMIEWIADFDRATPIDLLIANAGVMAGTRPGQHSEPPDAAHALMETNVLGVLNTVQPCLPGMMARGRGQIAIMSSLAGFVPLPDAPSYSASKSAVLNYGLALRALLAPHGVGVSVICLGYVDTPMTQQESGRKPFKMQADDAAERICRAIARNRALIVLPRFFGALTRIGGLLPDRVRRWTMRPFRFTVTDLPS